MASDRTAGAATPPRDATPFVPSRRSPDALRAAAPGCRGCPLHERATQTVLGEGPCPAELMLVGEVPGDQEDRAGHVFVGPAGRELERAGLARADAYVTNAVKHFKFEERGTRRLHQRPSRWEVRARNPWLRAELEAVAPRVLVLLGATAGQAVLGAGFKLGAARGAPIDSDLAEVVVATAHPSSVLRGPRRRAAGDDPGGDRRRPAPRRRRPARLTRRAAARARVSARSIIQPAG